MKIILREKIFILVAFVMGVGGMVGVLKNLPESRADKMQDFDPGRIMDDAVMANYKTMDERAIQKFLKSKNKCNDRDIEKAKKYPKMKYHIKNGTFVCMADEDFDGESAAKIIADAARDFQINPQVLIVLLEKEQSLVTDTWPNSNLQYRSATGYGCPDTAACDAEYYGFKNQVRNAAKMFRKVLNGGFTNFPLGKNYIRYNPDSSCGGSQVIIKNLATSALYRYTPYQPNKAAVAAGYGKGDKCSAYGNRNFYRYFRDWFGSTWVNGSEQANNNEGTLTQRRKAHIGNNTYYISTGRREFLGNYLKFAEKDGSNLRNAIVAGKREDDESQKFKVEYVAAGDYYLIQNVKSGKMLNLREPVNGSNIHEYKRTNNCDERWNIVYLNGKLVIESKCQSELYMAVRRENGILNVYAKRGEPEEWNFTEAGKPMLGSGDMEDKPRMNRRLADGEYVVKSGLGGGLVMDVAWAGKQDGAKVQIWKDNRTGAQKFKVKYNATKGAYTLTNVNSGKVLDVQWAKTENGTLTHQWYVNGSCAQDWKIMEAGGGYYKLVSGCSGKVLDVQWAKAAEGTPLQIWFDNGTAAQKWSFERVN